MTSLRIIDSITDRGDPKRANEDSFGGNRHCAFVVDGATGLGGDFLDVGTSDAAWLARFAKDCFEELVNGERTIADVVRTTNERVRSVVQEALHGREVPPWSLPVAGFQMACVEGQELVTTGLGDCRLFVVDAAGAVHSTSAEPEAHHAEAEEARLAIAVGDGGLGRWRSLSQSEPVRAGLRERRAGFNRPGGLWTLGTEPCAAKHLVERRIRLELPARGLLCTDGFAALTDRYRRHDEAAFVAKAAEGGLVPLLAELRRVEQREDPEGRLYPRFKVSDDATAVLFEIV